MGPSRRRPARPRGAVLAALPGAFHPRRLRTSTLGFERPDAIPRMLLTDGGVYDNMATEWPVRLAQRVREGAAPEPRPHVCDELIVVNSSAAQGVRGEGQRRHPAAR
jgi:hypothetical protein